MLHYFTKKAFTAFLLATAAATVTAQTLQPPALPGITYGAPNMKSSQRASNHAMAEADLATDNRISTSPNPLNDQLNVSVTTTENSVVELLLTDMSRRTVAYTNNALFKGTLQLNIDKLNGITPGNYLLTVLINQKKAGAQKVTQH